MARRSPLLPIFLIVLVDVLGFTIVIPLLAFYAERFGASPLVATTLVSAYAVCSLLSTPIIGNLSDRFGRRPLLLISQAGTCLGFLMLAFANSLWMVFVGRILDGITAGNLSIAQAYISDHTEPQNRAKAFGVIGVAFGIGFSFGPGLGGVLSEYYGHHMPFIVAACLSATSMFATYTLLKEDAKPAELHRNDAPAGPGGKRPGPFDIATYAKYFRRPELGRLYLQFFLFSFAFSCFISNFALFSERRFTIEHGVTHIAGTCTVRADDKLELPGAKRGTLSLDGTPLVYERDWIIRDESTIEVRGNACARMSSAKLVGHFPWSAHEVGLLFVYSGILGILLQGGLLGRLVKRYGEYRLVVAGFVTAALGYALLGVTYTLTPLLVAATLNAFGNGVLRPALTSQLTQAADRTEQGVVIGISGSLSSFAMMLAPPTGGALLNREWLLAWALIPAAVAVLGLLVAIGSRLRGVSSAP